MNYDLILKHWKGRQDIYAWAPPGGNFRPERGEVTVSYLEASNKDGNSYGFYLLDEESHVSCACYDIDNHEGTNPKWREQLRFVVRKVLEAGYRPVIELSQSGNGAHVWFFFEKPVLSAYVRRALASKKFAFKELDPQPEIYPKQDKLKEGGLGNLVRYPGFNKSCFLDPTTLEPLDCDPEIELMAVPEVGIPEVRVDADPSGLPGSVSRLLANDNSLLARRWRGNMEGLKDKSNSALVQSLACEMVYWRIPTRDIEQAIRDWCIEHNYEKGNRPDWIETTVAKAYTLTNDRPANKVGIKTVKDAALKYITSGKKVMFPSGLAALDRRIGGASPGELVLIAGRPSHCKSAKALQWADYTAQNGVPVLVCSAEMSEWEVGRRACLGIGETNPILAKELIEEHYGKRAQIWLEDDCAHIDTVCRLINQHARANGVRLVMVDYAQLLRSDKAGRYEAVTEISQKLKEAAKANDVAIICAAQMSRRIEERMKTGEHWEPTGADLKESGQLEQDADKVIFVCRPWAYDPNKYPRETYWVKIEKNRNGGILGSQYILSEIKFNEETQEFTDAC